MTSAEITVPRLVVIEPPEQAGLVLVIDRPEMVIGQSDTADLVLADAFVSRRHALVTTDAPGAVTIRDLNSTGGTWVNDERLEGPRRLRAGDLVRFANLGALHDTLTVIGLRIEDAERDTRSYGASTAAAVFKLQALAGIEQTGAVDENTRAIVSLALDRLGIRATETGFTARETRYLVRGTITDADGMPLANARVVAFDCELRSAKPIGETRTDHTGAYRIAFDADDLYDGRIAADLRVELQTEDGHALFSSPVNFRASDQDQAGAAGVLGGRRAAGRAYPVAGRTVLRAPPVRSSRRRSCDGPGQLDQRRGPGGERSGSTRWRVVDVGNHGRSRDRHRGGHELIPPSYASRAADDLANLAALGRDAALNSTQSFGKTSFANVLDAVSVAAQTRSSIPTTPPRPSRAPGSKYSPRSGCCSTGRTCSTRTWPTR